MTTYEVYARHGEYDAETGGLTPKGVEQAGALGNFIAEQHFSVTLGDSIILHGQALRAGETAKIIAEILGLQSEESRYLGGPEGKPVLESWMFEGLSPVVGAYGLMVCVTHEQQTTVLARAARNAYYGRNGGPDITPLPMGGAYVLNREQRTVYQYSPEDPIQDH